MLDFLAYLELERGLSRNTLEAYRTDLQQFGAWLDEHGHSALEVTHTELAEFIGQLGTGERGNGQAVAPATVQRKVACLRSFYRHLRREEILDHDPTAELRAPPQRPASCRRCSRAPRSSACSTRRAAPSRAALRDRALLELMYACGLRASEAIGLEVADVDLEDGVLRAHGKGSKERLVPVGRQAVAAVRAYVERGRPRLVGDRAEPRLFVNSPRHRPHAPGPLQDRPAPRRERRPGRPDEPAHAAPHLRHAPARRRLRPALACRRCSATPTSPRRRSTRTSPPSA